MIPWQLEYLQTSPPFDSDRMVPRGKARELSGHEAERPGFIEGDGEVGVLN